MRRALLSLFLLCFAWSQAFAAECPVLAHEGGAEHAPAASAHAGHGDGGHPGEHTHPRSGPRHADGLCAMSAACGIAAPPAAAGPVAKPPVEARDAHPFPAEQYASPHLGTDPPPPRPR